MPLTTTSPTSTTSKTSSDDRDPSARVSEAAARKKKNADAQAAFRARRANYIATLEETVTNLEAVVLQLQDSCREAKNEADKLRAENARIRHESRDREKIWRAFWQAKKSGQGPDPTADDFPLPTYAPVHTPTTTIAPLNPHVNHYSDDTMRFSSADPSPSLSHTPYNPAATPEYPHRSPAMTFAGIDHEAQADARSQHPDPHRVQRYAQYGSYPLESPSRDGTNWSHPTNGTNDPNSMENNASCPSPAFVESPSMTSTELGYAARFQVGEDQKVQIPPLNTTPYMFPGSRSMSPASSTPTSTSSTSIAPFQFTFPEGTTVEGRPEFNYRRQNGHPPELTLHGGTADIPIAGSSGDALRYRLGPRGGPPPDRHIVPAISPYSRNENSSHDRESDESEAQPYHYATRARQRRNNTASRSSRSPSPGPPQICGTLAVIKAQAFGALRRTRTRTRKSSEGAAKAAVEALEARGIGMGIPVGSKRPRIQHDDDEPQS